MPTSTRYRNTKIKKGSVRRKSRSSGGIDWVNAPDIKKKVASYIKSLGIKNYEVSRIICYRSTGAKTRAYARIWGLSRVWQQALKIKPAYILEVISEKFDRLSEHQKEEVLLHEIAHIPMNFSGALIPHKRRGAGNFHDKLKKMILEYGRAK